MLLIKESISLFYWIIIILIAPKIFKRDLELRRRFIYASIVPLVFVFINSYATFGKSRHFVAMLKRDKMDFSLGLISYPLGYLIALYLAYNYCGYYAGIGIMALGYGDGFAAIIGKKFNFKTYYIWGNKKTISGTLGMFLCTFISVLTYCVLFNIKPVINIAFVAALVGSVVEAIAVRGTDNVLIPLIVILTYIMF